MIEFELQSVNGRRSLSRYVFNTLKAALEYYHMIYSSGYPIRILELKDHRPVAVIQSDWWHLLGRFGFVEK